MPVSPEEYQKLVQREMARFRTSPNSKDQDVRDQAVRAANVAAGYGQSTALKHPVKGRDSGGRSMSRESGNAGAGGGGGQGGQGGQSGGGGGGRIPTPTPRPPSNKPGRLSDEYVKPVPDNPRPPAGVMSDEYVKPAGPNPRPPAGMVSDENAGAPPSAPGDWPIMPALLKGLPIELTPPSMLPPVLGVPPDLSRPGPMEGPPVPQFGPMQGPPMPQDYGMIGPPASAAPRQVPKYIAPRPYQGPPMSAMPEPQMEQPMVRSGFLKLLDALMAPVGSLK